MGNQPSKYERLHDDNKAYNEHKEREALLRAQAREEAKRKDEQKKENERRERERKDTESKKRR